MVAGFDLDRIALNGAIVAAVSNNVDCGIKFAAKHFRNRVLSKHSRQVRGKVRFPLALVVPDVVGVLYHKSPLRGEDKEL